MPLLFPFLNNWDFVNQVNECIPHSCGSSVISNRHNCHVDLNFYDVPETPENKFKPIPLFLTLLKFADTVKENCLIRG